MNTLELIKNYTDAKIAYELSPAAPDPTASIRASVSYTPETQRIVDRYIEAETQLNLAIEAERRANP